MLSRASVSTVACATSVVVVTFNRRLLLSARGKTWPTTASAPATTVLARRHFSAGPPVASSPAAISAQTPDGVFFVPPDGLVNAKISAGLEPSLAELGVQGMWPPDLIQQALEWLHCSAELPWWASITALVVTSRILLFPVMAIHRRNMAAYTNSMFEQQELNVKMLKAAKAGRHEEFEWLQKQSTKFMSQAFPQIKRVLAVPMLTFMPVFGSTFYGLNRLSASGLPSLETGGALWFTDLTVPDPFLGLPVLSIATTYAMLIAGTEMPKLQEMVGSKFAKFMLFGLPLIAMPLAMHFSAAVVYFWSLNNLLSLAQGFVLRKPAVAKAFNIPEMRRPSQELTDSFAEFKDMFKVKRDAGLPIEIEEQIRKLKEKRRSGEQQ